MADLKTIIQITHDEQKKQQPVREVLMGALEGLRPREADVLRRRYGLRDGKVETLQHIGAEFGITRERVRQIEKQGTTAFQKVISKAPVSDLLKQAMGLIRDHGGSVSRNELLSEFLPESQREAADEACVDFLLAQSPDITLVPEQRGFKPMYVLSEAHAKAVQALAPVLKEKLAAAKRPMSAEDLTAQVTDSSELSGSNYLLSFPLVHSTLQISTYFVPADATSWGLATWATINPRNIREKTLYMLKKVGTPLHFTEITEKIKQANFDSKRVTTQAVHNELINGDEFVLIGRGIYALKEWGYTAGTVADVITAILKKSGTPMDREAVIEEVLKQRHVSRNTVLINLQDKAHFKRVAKHTYALASAGEE